MFITWQTGTAIACATILTAALSLTASAAGYRPLASQDRAAVVTAGRGPADAGDRRDHSHPLPGGALRGSLLCSGQVEDRGR